MFVQVFEEKLKEDWGKKPLCNRMPERAPHIGAFCFPICWRCLGISLGVITLFVAYSLGLVNWSEDLYVRLVVLVGIAPCLVDYLLQRWTKYTSNNPKRFVFGMLSGMSIRMVCIWIFGV